MGVNGLDLPASFVKLCQDIREGKTQGQKSTRSPSSFDLARHGAERREGITMAVNGLRLPEAFVELIGRPDQPYQWVPKEDALDASGRPFRLRVLPLELYTDQDRIESDTAVLSRLFREENRFQGLPALPQPDHSVPDPTDISQIIWFGSTSSGEPYCFDFRGDPAEPRVIHWDDSEWLVLAANFAAFMDLFEPGSAEG